MRGRASLRSISHRALTSIAAFGCRSSESPLLHVEASMRDWSRCAEYVFKLYGKVSSPQDARSFRRRAANPKRLYDP